MWLAVAFFFLYLFIIYCLRCSENFNTTGLKLRAPRHGKNGTLPFPILEFFFWLKIEEYGKRAQKTWRIEFSKTFLGEMIIISYQRYSVPLSSPLCFCSIMNFWDIYHAQRIVLIPVTPLATSH